MDEVARISRQLRMVAGKLDARAAFGERHRIKDVHRMKHCFQFMKTIRPFAEDVQEQVYFAGRLFSERHAGYFLAVNGGKHTKKRPSKKASTPNRFGVG